MLSTSRIQLRPLDEATLPLTVEWLNDARVTKTLLSIEPKTLAGQQAFLKHLQTTTLNKVYVIFRKGDDEMEPIGATGLHRISLENGSCTCGIFVGRVDLWGQGYASEALAVLLDHAFFSLRLHRVELEVFAEHPSAMKVYRRLGFQKEGVRREAVFKDGKFIDNVLMSMLAPEWAKRRKEGGEAF